ncbi:MAG: hypothetical protein KatS3mg124_1735 [Porticoccaceae bacterium]|nr:MAG: hypothetical protein KatS3mg124_1735 [Porticoccaceae bacterium]
MLAIIARYQFSSAADADRFCRHALDLVEPSRAEPGCHLYAFARDIGDGRVVWICEEWASQQALDAHLRSPHVKAFLADVADIEIVAADTRQYEVSSVGPVVMPED